MLFFIYLTIGIVIFLARKGIKGYKQSDNIGKGGKFLEGTSSVVNELTKGSIYLVNSINNTSYNIDSKSISYSIKKLLKPPLDFNVVSKRMDTYYTFRGNNTNDISDRGPFGSNRDYNSWVISFYGIRYNKDPFWKEDRLDVFFSNFENNTLLKEYCNKKNIQYAIITDYINKDDFRHYPSKEFLKVFKLTDGKWINTGNIQKNVKATEIKNNAVIKKSHNQKPIEFLTGKNYLNKTPIGNDHIIESKNIIDSNKSDNINNLNTDELISVVNKFITEKYIESFKVFENKDYNLIDGFLSPIDHLILKNQCDFVKLKLKEILPSLLKEFETDTDNKWLLETTWDTIISETEKNFLEKYLNHRKIKLASFDGNNKTEKKTEEANNEDNSINSLYFYKFTQTKKGLVTSSQPLNLEINKTKDVVFGFTAISPELASQMNLKVGDELPLNLTEKQVINTTTGELIPNLYWAE